MNRHLQNLKTRLQHFVQRHFIMIGVFALILIIIIVPIIFEPNVFNHGSDLSFTIPSEPIDQESSSNHTLLLDNENPMHNAFTFAVNAWTVELSEKFNQADAQRLIDKLRGFGFSVYCSNANPNNAAHLTIFVGPEINYENAKALQNKLAEMQLDGNIIRFEPLELIR